MTSAEFLGDSRVQALADSLAERRGPLPARLATSEPGIYALWLTHTALDSLELKPGSRGIAYLGVGEGKGGLGRRFGEEWRPRHSGRSSPRRTLGALLTDELGLEPRPRPGAAHARNANYYTFGEEGEERLTEWLDQHADFAHLEVTPGALGFSGTLVGLEAALIQYCEPPLNLTKWANPSAPRIALARKASAERAKLMLP